MAEIAWLIIAIAYAIFSIASWIVLAKWLHVNKHEELGKTWVTEIVFGFILAAAWPMSIPLMVINDYCK